MWISPDTGSDMKYKRKNVPEFIGRVSPVDCNSLLRKSKRIQCPKYNDEQLYEILVDTCQPHSTELYINRCLCFQKKCGSYNCLFFGIVCAVLIRISILLQSQAQRSQLFVSLIFLEYAEGQHLIGKGRKYLHKAKVLFFSSYLLSYKGCLFLSNLNLNSKFTYITQSQIQHYLPQFILCEFYIKTPQRVTL